MYSTGKPSQTVLEVVKNFPRLMNEELKRIGENTVSFCSNDKIWNRIEQKLKGVSVPEGISSGCIPASSIVVYSKSLATILDTYGSLDSFWERICEAVNTPLACMVLHEAKTSPHVHVLFKFKDVVSLEDVASSLDEIYMDKLGKSEVRTHAVDYLFDNLYNSYCCALHCDRSHGIGAVGMLVKITPALAEYLVKYENLMVNESYKEYIRKEQKEHEEK